MRRYRNQCSRLGSGPTARATHHSVVADVPKILPGNSGVKLIDCVLPLDQALEGLRMIQDREVIGKVVIKP